MFFVVFSSVDLLRGQEKEFKLLQFVQLPQMKYSRRRIWLQYYKNWWFWENEGERVIGSQGKRVFIHFKKVFDLFSSMNLLRVQGKNLSFFNFFCSFHKRSFHEFFSYKSLFDPRRRIWHWHYKKLWFWDNEGQTEMNR